MFRNTLTRLVLPVVAAAALMVAAGPVRAQHGGGHGGGGFHAGGFHAGGFGGVHTAGGFHAGGFGGVRAAGVNVAGVRATGVRAASVNATGVRAAGVNAASVNATGVSATGIFRGGFNGVNAAGIFFRGELANVPSFGLHGYRPSYYGGYGFPYSGNGDYRPVDLGYYPSDDLGDYPPFDSLSDPAGGSYMSPPAVGSDAGTVPAIPSTPAIDPSVPTTSAPAGLAAHITVRLPDNADLWFNGTPGARDRPGPGVRHPAAGPRPEVQLRGPHPLDRPRRHHGPEADGRVRTRRPPRGPHPGSIRNRRGDRVALTAGTGPGAVPGLNLTISRPVPVGGP